MTQGPLKMWIRSRIGLEALAACFAVGCSSPSQPGPGVTDGGPDAGEAFGDSGAADASVDCGALDWGSTTCASCTDTHCCALEAQCAAIASCAPLDQCWRGCAGDASCTMSCGKTYIDSISNYNAVLNCQANACPVECGP